MRLRTALILLAIAATLGAAMVGCFIILWANSSEEVITYQKLEHPLSEARFIYGDVSVSTAPGVTAETLVPLTCFGNFKPGMTASEAEVKFGAPDRIWTDLNSTNYVYKLPEADVSVVHYQIRWDGWFNPPADWDQQNDRWLLYARPREASFENEIHPSLQKLSTTVTNGELTIIAEGHPSLRLYKTNGIIQEIRWHSKGGW